MPGDRRQTDVLEDAERFQRLFVAPMIDAVRAEMQTHLAPLVEAQTQTEKRLHDTEDRLTKIEGSQTKALVGWGAFASVGAVVIGSAWGWVKSKLHWG